MDMDLNGATAGENFAGIIRQQFADIMTGKPEPLELLIKSLEKQPESFELHYILGRFYKFLKLDTGATDELKLADIIVAEKLISAQTQKQTTDNIDDVFTAEKIKYFNSTSESVIDNLLNYYNLAIKNATDDIQILRCLSEVYLLKNDFEKFYRIAGKYKSLRPNSRRIRLYYIFAFLKKNKLLPASVFNIIYSKLFGFKL